MEWKTAEHRWPLKSGLGNHRILLEAPAGKYVRVVIPWRRRDLAPDTIGVKMRYTPQGDVPEEGMGAAEVKNIYLEKMMRFEGVIVFEAPESGVYELYYMPYQLTPPSHCPTTEYMKPKDIEADEQWLCGLKDADMLLGKALRYEARTDFDSFYPMEAPMTRQEADAFAGGNPFALVVQSRLMPIRMQYELPAIWLDRAQEDLRMLRETVCRNEHYAFPIAVCANEALSNISIAFYDENGHELPKQKCICFNTTGRDIDGNETSFCVKAAKNEVLPLWCGVDAEQFAGQNKKRYTGNNLSKG